MPSYEASPGSRESTTASSRSASFSQYARSRTLAAKAGALREAQRGDVLRRDEHLEAAEAERLDRPLRQKSQRLGGDPAATGRRNDTAAELTHPMFAEHSHHLTEVGVVYSVGDHEMKQPAFPTALLEVVRDTRAVGGRQRRNPVGCRRILTELERCIEVVGSERAQSERRAGERGVRVGDGHVMGVVCVEGTAASMGASYEAEIHPDEVMRRRSACCRVNTRGSGSRPTSPIGDIGSRSSR